MRCSYRFEWIYQELEQGSPRHQQSAARRNFPKAHEPRNHQFVWKILMTENLP